MDTQEQKYCAKACFNVLKSSPEQSSFQLTFESNFHLLLCCLNLLAVSKKKKNRATFSTNQKCNQNQSRHAQYRFVLSVGYMYLVHCVVLFLSVVMVKVTAFVLQDTQENRSNT